MGAVGTQTVDTTERLAALRNLMAERNIDAYVVPSEDQRRHFRLIRSRAFGDTTRLQIWASTLPSVTSVGGSYLGLVAPLVRPPQKVIVFSSLDLPQAPQS